MCINKWGEVGGGVRKGPEAREANPRVFKCLVLGTVRSEVLFILYLNSPWGGDMFYKRVLSASPASR